MKEKSLCPYTGNRCTEALCKAWVVGDTHSKLIFADTSSGPGWVSRTFAAHMGWPEIGKKSVSHCKVFEA